MSLTVFRLPLIMHATGLFRVPGDMRVVSELRKVVDKAGYFDTKLNTVAVYPTTGSIASVMVIISAQFKF